MVYEKSGNSYSAYEELDYIENPEEAPEEATSVYDPNSFDLEEHEQDGTIEIHRCTPDDAYIPKQVVYDNSHDNYVASESSVSKKDSTINNVAKNSAPKQSETLTQNKTLSESLEHRILALRRAEDDIERYMISHHCTYSKAIEALDILDPDDQANYGLRRNEDGSYAFLEEEPKKSAPCDILARAAVAQVVGLDVAPEPEDDDSLENYVFPNGKTCSYNDIERWAKAQGLSENSYILINKITLIHGNRG